MAIAIPLTVMGALLRLAPHFPNSSPMGAMHLYSGSKVTGWSAWLLPMGLMLLTDLIIARPLAQIGFSAFSWMTPVIYASLLLNVAIGRQVHKNFRLWKLPIGSLAGSVQFFLITNFAVWAASSEVFYPKSFPGLMACYLAGLEFCGYGASFLFDLGWCLGFFAVHHALTRAIEFSRKPQTNEICS